MPHAAPTDAELARLAVELGAVLRRKRLKLAVAESCTGGWVAKCVTDVAGSSQWFDRGFVAYTNRAKQDLLGVTPAPNDGSLDSTFNPSVDGGVYSLALLAEGKVVAGGDFATLGGQPRTRIARLINTEPAMQSLASDGSTITWTRSAPRSPRARAAASC